MSKKGLTMLVIMFILIGMIPIDNEAEATGSDGLINVVLNGNRLDFDVEPIIKEGRTLMPLRVIYEALGLNVQWDANSKRILGHKEGLEVELTIDHNRVVINGEDRIIDVPPTIINGRTLVPARFVAESTGARVSWDGRDKTVYIENQVKPSKFNLNIGMDVERVLEALGQPQRKDLSKYGFEWYIYNDDYSKYIQVGVKDGSVVGIYTNSQAYQILDKITIGRLKDTVNKTYGSALYSIKKDHVVYQFNSNGGEMDLYHRNGAYITVFYDIYDGNKVTAVQIIDEKIEENFKGFYAEPSERLRGSYERQLFDLANAIRARHGLSPYKWDEDASKVARKHSEDMAIHTYFDHTNPKGESPFDRLKNGGIQYRMAAENIASGQTGAIFAHQGWMNSKGHRQNILGDCERLGTGVYFGGSYHVYYTQNFYTPR